jgi:hypothetical protein
MAVLNDFDIATDLKVEMYLPQGINNVFVLGISKLDGPDVLGDDASGTMAWQDLACEVNQVQTSVGGSMASNVYFQADAGRATIQMQSWYFDPNNFPFIRPGTFIRIMLRRDDYEYVFWRGFVDSIDVEYTVDQPNQITVQCTDGWVLAINQRFDFAPNGVGPTGHLEIMTPSYAIEIATQQVVLQGGQVLGYTPYASIDPEWNMTQTDIANTTFGAVMQNVLMSGLGFAWVDPDSGFLIYRPRASSGTPVWTVGNNHSDPYHWCMSDLTIASGTEDIYNSVLVNQKYEYLGNPVFEALYRDQDSIDLYLERSEDFTVDLATADDADQWAAAVMVLRPVTHVQSVVTPSIDRNGDLTNAAVMSVGEYLGVRYQTDDIDIDENYTITRVRHNIDVNNWFTTFELWKEF